MKTWTKEEGLKTLKELANEADRLTGLKAFSTEHTVWWTKCVTVLGEIFGQESTFYRSFCVLDWRNIPGGTIIDPMREGYGGDYGAAISAKKREVFLRDLETAKGLLLGAVAYLENREISEVKTKDMGQEASLILKILEIAERQLRKTIRTQPNKESQVQDAFENLLIGADIPYQREGDRIEYSSKTYVPDFSLPKVNLAIELKLCNNEEREKKIIAEINDDILAYQTKYQNLIFIVYDIGCIRDAERFGNSFEGHQNVRVRIVKH